MWNLVSRSNNILVEDQIVVNDRIMTVVMTLN